MNGHTYLSIARLIALRILKATCTCIDGYGMHFRGISRCIYSPFARRVPSEFGAGHKIDSRVIGTGFLAARFPRGLEEATEESTFGGRNDAHYVRAIAEPRAQARVATQVVPFTLASDSSGSVLLEELLTSIERNLSLEAYYSLLGAGCSPRKLSASSASSIQQDSVW